MDMPTHNAKKPKSSLRHSIYRFINHRISLVFPLPALLTFALLLAFPVFYVINMSFHEWDLSALIPPEFIGFDNYINAFQDSRFWHALWITFYFTALSMGGTIVLGVAVALLVHRDFFGKGLVRVILIIPMTATPVALSLIWSMMLEPTMGIMNYFLESLGLSALYWAADPNLAVPTLALIDVWFWTPFIALIVMAGLQGIPEEVLEAARLDGAKGTKMLFKVILPLVRPHIVMAAVLRVIPTLKTFDQIYMITGGGPLQASETLNLYVFLEGFEFFNLGYASTLGVLLLIAILLITIFINKFRAREWTY